MFPRVTDVVCGVIEDEQGRVLACRRPAGGPLGGCWEFPGGKVEPGESTTAALVRELREELAVTVTVGAPLTPVVWDYGRGAFRLIPFRCRIIGGALSLLEHDACQWCGPAQANLLGWAPADVSIVAEVWGGGSEAAI